MKIPIEWERIEEHRTDEATITTLRSKTIGGWLVKSVFEISESLTFVPDVYHQWEV